MNSDRGTAGKNAFGDCVFVIFENTRRMLVIGA